MANVDRYVDTDAGNDANAGTSWGAAWATMNKAFDDAVANKVSTDTWRVYCRGDAVDSTEITIDAVANTTASNPLQFYGAAGESNGRHAGLWSETKFIHRRTGSSQTNVAVSASAYVDFIGLQFASDGAWSTQPRNISGSPGTGRIRLRECLFNLGGSKTSGDSAINISINGSTAWTCIVANCVSRQAMSFFRNDLGYSSDAGIVIVLYNNTAVEQDPGNAAYGSIFINQDAGNAYIKNNVIELASGATGSAYLKQVGSGSTVTASNNLTSDGSLGSTGTKTYVDKTGGDLHLTASDAGGADLSADPQLAFSNDMDDATRTGTWDRGADQTAGGGGGTIPVMMAHYRRIWED